MFSRSQRDGRFKPLKSTRKHSRFYLVVVLDVCFRGSSQWIMEDFSIGSCFKVISLNSILCCFDENSWIFFLSNYVRVPYFVYHLINKSWKKNLNKKVIEMFIKKRFEAKSNSIKCACMKMQFQGTIKTIGRV